MLIEPFELGKTNIAKSGNGELKFHDTIALVAKETDGHERLGHEDNGTLILTAPIVEGMRLTKSSTAYNCDTRRIYMSTRTPRPEIHTNEMKKLYPLELMNTDVCGLIKPMKMVGGKYISRLYDGATAFSAVRVIREKSEARKKVFMKCWWM